MLVVANMSLFQLKEVARLWLEAGADVLTTATYQTSADLMKDEFEITLEESKSVLRSAVELLADCRKTFWDSASPQQCDSRRFPKISVSMGPYNAVLPGTNEYSGRYDGVSQQELVNFHRKRCSVFDNLIGKSEEPKAQLYCFETIGNKCEALSIVDVMTERERRAVPFWMSFQCRDSEHLANGDKLAAVVRATLAQCLTRNLVAIGVNCVKLIHVQQLVQTIKTAVHEYMEELGNSAWRVDVMAYPNSAEVWTEQGWKWPKENVDHGMDSWASTIVASGATAVGGCCRIGPEGIRCLHKIRTKRG